MRLIPQLRRTRERMIQLLLTVLLLLTGQTFDRPQRIISHPPDTPSPQIMVMNSSALPVRIDTARPESLTLDTWIAYSVSNTSREQVNSIELRIFIVDSMGKLVDIKQD